MHRVGRTARAGRRGQALVYLLPSEDTYIHFLGIHKVRHTLGVDCEVSCGSRIEPLTPSCWSPLLSCCVQVPICRRPAAPKVPDVLEKVKQLAMTDRDVLEKGTRAFVSFVRG